MRFRQLEVFFAIMQAGSVSAAAERLRVSQPSVTKTLKQAEESLGYDLFDRVKGRLQPTEEARVLFKEAGRAYAALEDVRQLGRRLKNGVEGILRVASTPSLGLDLLPEAIARYAAETGRVRFEASTQHSGDLLAALGRPGHGFDLGFTFGAEGAPLGVGVVEVGRAPLACLAPPAMLADLVGPVRFDDLAGRPMVGLEENEPLGRLLGAHFHGRGATPSVVVRAQTYRLACDLAARGLGVAVVDGFTAANVMRGDPSLKVLPFEPEASLPVTAVYPLAQGAPLAARRMIVAFETALANARADLKAIGLAAAS